MEKVSKVVESAKASYQDNIKDNIKVDKVKGMFSNAYTKVWYHCLILILIVQWYSREEQS